MKAMKQTREAAHLVVVSHLENGVKYECQKCGYTTEANAYYEEDYKNMVTHALKCNGMKTSTPSRALVPGSRQVISNNEVELLAEQIKLCIPGGRKLNDHEALALAQVALSTDLNPFIGEIYYLPGVGPDAGIEGMRRKAKEQAPFSVDTTPMREEERQLHGLDDTDHGSICRLFRHDVLRSAVEINKAAGKEIIPIKPVIGIGIWRKGDNVARTKTPQWMSDKRAEKDAIRKAYDLGLNAMPGDDEWTIRDETNGSNAGWSVVSEPDEEMIRRQAAINGERRAQAEGGDDGAAKHASASGYDDAIAKYKADGAELPPWVQEIRGKIAAHPKVSDPVDNVFVKQLEISAGRKVKPDQFRAFAEIILTHPLNDLTFGEATVLMNVINGKEFEAQVIGLLS